MVERPVFDDAAPSEGSDKPGPGSAAEPGIDGTDHDVVRDGTIKTRDLYGRERGEWNGKRGLLGIKGRELVDDFWVDLADSINVEKTRVLEGLEDLSVDVVKIDDIFFFIVLLREGHVDVGVVGSGGGNVELGGEEGVVFRSYNVRIPILVITVDSLVREPREGREGKKHTGSLFVPHICTSKDWVSCRCSLRRRYDAYEGRKGRGRRARWGWRGGSRVGGRWGWRARMGRWRGETCLALEIGNMLLVGGQVSSQRHRPFDA